MPGTVVALADFGAFVDLGGVQGLVPVSEVAHGRGGRPSDRLHVGDNVSVKVLRVDTEKGKVTLSLKALDSDPWLGVPGTLRDRMVLRARAVRATDFGVFVELLPAVDGLLHQSEIPRHRQGEIRAGAAAGAEITVMIISVDMDKRRIALALAPDDAAPGEEMASSVTVGAVLTGTVERVEPFGVFVRLGPGQTGLVPNAEITATRGGDLRKALPAGNELRVVVLSIEEGGRRIRLSRRPGPRPRGQGGHAGLSPRRREEELGLQPHPGRADPPVPPLSRRATTASTDPSPDLQVPVSWGSGSQAPRQDGRFTVSVKKPQTVSTQRPSAMKMAAHAHFGRPSRRCRRTEVHPRPESWSPYSARFQPILSTRSLVMAVSACTWRMGGRS